MILIICYIELKLINKIYLLFKMNYDIIIDFLFTIVAFFIFLYSYNNLSKILAEVRPNILVNSFKRIIYFELLAILSLELICFIFMLSFLYYREKIDEKIYPKITGTAIIIYSIFILISHYFIPQIRIRIF